MGINTEKGNINGGAISLGRPTACSGARLSVTLYHVLRQNDKEPVVAGLFGFLIGNEIFTWYAWIGCSLIFVAILITVIKEEEEEKKIKNSKKIR